MEAVGVGGSGVLVGAGGGVWVAVAAAWEVAGCTVRVGVLAGAVPQAVSTIERDRKKIAKRFITTPPQNCYCMIFRVCLQLSHNSKNQRDVDNLENDNFLAAKYDTIKPS